MPDAGRVVTGFAGGLRLEAPGPGTRPLSDKVKQALFSMVEAEREEQLVVVHEVRRGAEDDLDAVCDALRRAVAEERARIARELHDVVAHQVSMMTVQAGAARTIAHADLDAAVAAMGDVETAGRQALGDRFQGRVAR